MTAEVVLETAVVVTVNVAVVAPAATVTVPGTVAELLPEPRVTTSPVGPAGPVRVTVPVELEPPTTEVGSKVTLLIAGMVTVKVADFAEAPNVAVTVAVA
jgi:hypothetical protein